MTNEQQLEHRLAMIQDDLNAIRKFIYDSKLISKFEEPTKYADHVWTHFDNIDIACDLNCTESRTWKLFTK
jgi:hypothetical protein